ncbi:M12 family metallopeptidase [Hymenobacter fodinae]|uniref:Peptidase M12A domain-containing protein n=1 Tax=Hymenobacter fodinae TaxID=2510796 RepID=A0A4Z0NZQ6_9BACT|nr:M12 family metallopeptidase [Hymenobacter fodinae]TGE03559.1 hypothetical protein EU556_25545 [Hymenobacter fodinae]
MKNTPLNLCTTRPHGGEYGLYVALQERADNVMNAETEPVYGHKPARYLLQEIAAGHKEYSELLISQETVIGRKETREILHELALLHTHFWQPGRALRVRFLGGEAHVHRQIETVAKTWETHANITFDFIAQGQAEVRISFTRSGSWSLVGTDALTERDQNKATMNFDLSDETTSPDAFPATILHEFGHCLGCVHEHQSPAAAIQWNKPLIYSRLFQAYGWDRQKVDTNFFEQAEKALITNSGYDPLSIMHYSFPPEFTVPPTPTPHNTQLSAQDIAFISRCYPFPASSTASTLLKG